MPILAGLLHIRSFLFGRKYCLFLKVNPSLFRARHTVRSDAERPSLSRSSRAQRSGSWVASCLSRAKPSSPRMGLRPRFSSLFGARMVPLVRKHRITFLTNVGLTGKRSETSTVVSPDCLASNMRRRMSTDIAAGIAPLISNTTTSNYF